MNAPPERVWAIVADPRNLPRWDHHVTKVEGVPEGGLRTGSRYRTEIRTLGIATHTDAEVRDIRPPEYAEIDLSGPALRATVRTRLTRLDGGRTRLDQEVEYHLRGGAVGDVVGRALRHLGAESLLRHGTEAQKLHVEDEAPPARDDGW